MGIFRLLQPERLSLTVSIDGLYQSRWDIRRARPLDLAQ